MLGTDSGSVVVLKSEKDYFLHTVSDIFYKPVGEANFTCCALNHMVNGKPIPCDRPQVAAFLAKLVEKYYFILFSKIFSKEFKDNQNQNRLKL